MCNVYEMCMCVGGGRCGCVGIMSVLACVCNVYVMCMCVGGGGGGDVGGG